MKRSSRSAFTLVELLVVIAIIVIVSAMAFAMLGNARQRGNHAASMSNLRQWGAALNASLADYNNHLPTTGMADDKVDFEDPDAWFNRLPRYLSARSMSDMLKNQDEIRHINSRTVWANPAVSREVVQRHHRPPEKVFFAFAMNAHLSTEIEPAISRARIDNAADVVFLGEQGGERSEIEPETLRAEIGKGDPLTSKDNSAQFLFVDGHVSAVPRHTFDPTHAKGELDPTNTESPPPGFTYVPFKGATSFAKK